ncbi:MAG: hypothetical protein EA424_29170 [Planctomycetaceae bacterium]|nr:MAG: hypothetical protein EA424_29170 [Planctomycetaceae bacterium]
MRRARRMNSKHRTCQSDWIEAFLDNRLDPQETRALQEHLDECESCRQAMDEACASPADWIAVRLSLGESRAVPSCPRDDSRFAAETASEERAAYYRSLLGPTDDPRMLGRIGSYEIVGVLGCGGMGIVFKAYDPTLNRYVAIKLLAPHFASSAAARERFFREARAAAAVIHENVIAIHTVATWQQTPYIVMHLVSGQTLQQRLASVGMLGLRETLRIGLQVAAGLAAAHEQGLIHRDVKPANILLEAGIDRVVLTDFGLARAVDDVRLTQRDTLLGTPQYMSPEQAAELPLDFRTDLFSLGSVLYECCCGRPAFQAATSYGVLRKIIDHTPPPPRDVHPDVPHWLERIIDRLMLKRPQDRYPSAAEVQRLLKQCLAHLEQPKLAALPKAILTSPVKRASFLLRSTAMTVLLVALLIPVALWMLPPASDRSTPTVPEAPAVTAAAEPAETPLRYDWQVGQTFAYNARVVVELPDRIETYQGTVQYTVNSVERDHRRVTYQGGLANSTRWKSEGRPSRSFPPFRPPGPSRGPFSRSDFRGGEQTTNEITISSTGSIVSIKGDSHLPYLIGNVSLLPFEPLPDSMAPQWEITTEAAVAEKDQRSNLRPMFGPFDPFGRGMQDQTVQAATESRTYEITASQGPLVTVAKTHELKSPAPVEGEVSFVLSGSGTWQFCRKEHVSESLRMDHKLLIAKDNQQVTVLIGIEYRRLTDAELAERQAARQEQLAEHQRRADELARAKAEQQRQAEAPLTEDERAAMLTALDGSDTTALSQALEELAEKDPQQPDAEIAEAIRRALSHADRPVREAAHRALLQWSPEYRPRGELDRRYRGRGSVESTARVVTADTPLYVGQIVQSLNRNRWVAADILELYQDGQVKVRPRGWTTTAWDKVVTRDEIQLAPEHLFQPYWIPGSSAENDLRNWTDATGAHVIEAELLDVVDGTVRLKRQDGREVSVPLDRLSQEDQQYIQRRSKSDKHPPNPFD